MSCTTDVCGVGNWSGPRPGDPDNNAVLSANGVFGGIEVSWTYPNTNSHAVAHTLLYRSIGDRFETAIQIAIVSGNQFFDRNTTDPIRTYYYWIQFVSINGTLMEPIGPATGYALDDLDRVIDGMAGKIEAGALATSLRSRIDKIADLEVGITNLSQTITDESSILSQTLLGVQSDIDATMSYYEQERDARLLADGALASAINTTVAQAKDELYAAVQESTDAQALVNGDLSAKYSVKVDLAGNVAGFGLASSGNVYDETIHSEFGVQADSFWVSGPSTVSATKPLTHLYHGRVWVDTSDVQNPVTKYYNKTTDLWQTNVVKGSVPFIVKTTEDPVTGVPAGVYIDSAYISKITANQIDARGLSIKDQDGNVILAAGTALDFETGVGGSGKPAANATAGSSLIKKSFFDDGLPGTWGYAGIENRVNAGMPYAKNIYFHARDNLENGADFPVTPGEVIYGAAWLETLGITDYSCCLGIRVSNANGEVVGWNPICAIPGNTGWTYVKGSTTVPAGGVIAAPWIQMDGTDFPANYQWLRAAGLYIGRHQLGATVGAPAGTYVGNTLAQTVEANASSALSGLSNKLNKVANDILEVNASSTSFSKGIRISPSTVQDDLLTWDADGNRTGGKGIALTPKGLLGHNGTDTTFAIDATTGDATFAGALSAATGTFSGTMTADAINAVNTINIAGQAVTIPVSAYTAAGLTLPRNIETVVQQATIASSGFPIYLSLTLSCWNGTVYVSAGDSSYYAATGTTFRVYRGTTLIRSVVLPVSGTVAISLQDTPGEGNITYYAKALTLAGANDGSASAAVEARCIFLLETKR